MSSSASVVHSERIAAGSCGSVPPPHSANRNSRAAGACSCAATTSATSAGKCSEAAVRSTGPCPRRSISRPCATAPHALARLNAPSTRPASANDPVESRTSNRIPRPNMPIGIEPAIERSMGARAPGNARSAR